MTTANISPQRDYFSHSAEAEREGGLKFLKTFVSLMRNIVLLLYFVQLTGCTDIKKNSFSGLQNSFYVNLSNLKPNHYSPPLNYKSTNYPGRQIPQHLMVDLLIAPEEAVITNTSPSFSWSVNDNRPGAKQTAWQIMIASSPENLDENEPDIWNSGKKISGKSFGIQYTGNELSPNRTYWWKIRTWDHRGRVGRWSKTQKFHIADVNPSGFIWPGKSRWVTMADHNHEDYFFENRHTIRYHDISPVSVIKNRVGNQFITFENTSFGTLKLNLEVKTPLDSLIIHLGEKMTARQQVDKKPGGSISYHQVKLGLKPGQHEYLVELPRQYSKYPNSQVLAGHMPEVAAFRYAEISGWPGNIKSADVKQHALFYRFDENASDFKSSDDKLNQIWNLCKHTLRVTPFLGLYIDGTRERMPYEADAYIQQISHYCVDREFAIQRHTNAFLIFNPSWPTEWHLHIVLMAWADYMATGDPRALEIYYDELKKKTLLPLAREDGLISTRTGLVTDDFLRSINYSGTNFRDIVDWPQGTPANERINRSGFNSSRIEGETDRFVFSDINTVVNAFHYRNLILMSKIAGILGKSDDNTFFHERASLVKSSFNQKLLNKKTGLYTDGEGVDHSSLHANMFPIAFGLAPEENYPALRDFLISKGMACSPYGALYLFEALYETGAQDYALKLLTSESDRSWMNMIRFGATITSEAWDIKYKSNMTWNHAWGASPAYIITRKLFGIEPLEPGFRKILIRPRPGTLKEAEIKSPVMTGTIHVKFTNEPEDAFTMDLVIPANTMAKLMLPVPSKDEISLKINGKEIPVKIEDGCVLVEWIEAGRYKIRID